MQSSSRFTGTMFEDDQELLTAGLQDYEATNVVTSTTTRSGTRATNSYYQQ